VFNEDQSTVHKDHAPQNMAIVRHVVLNPLNTAKNISKTLESKHYAKKQAGQCQSTAHFETQLLMGQP